MALTPVFVPRRLLAKLEHDVLVRLELRQGQAVRSDVGDSGHDAAQPLPDSVSPLFQDVLLRLPR